MSKCVMSGVTAFCAYLVGIMNAGSDPVKAAIIAVMLSLLAILSMMPFDE